MCLWAGSPLPLERVRRGVTGCKTTGGEDGRVGRRAAMAMATAMRWKLEPTDEVEMVTMAMMRER